jgi:hypothetical protein
MFFLVIAKVMSSCNNFPSVSGGVFFQVVSLAFNGGGLTRRAPGRRDSHRQNQLVLALSFSVSEMNPNPPAAGNASRWAAKDGQVKRKMINGQVNFE